MLAGFLKPVIAQAVSVHSGFLAGQVLPVKLMTMPIGQTLLQMKLPHLPVGIISDPLSMAVPDDIPVPDKLRLPVEKPGGQPFRLMLKKHFQGFYLQAEARDEALPGIHERLFIFWGHNHLLALDARPEGIAINELPCEYSQYIDTEAFDSEKGFPVVTYRNGLGRWMVKIKTSEGYMEVSLEEYQLGLSLYFESLLSLEFGELNDFTQGWNTPGGIIPLIKTTKKFRQCPGSNNNTPPSPPEREETGSPEAPTAMEDENTQPDGASASQTPPPSGKQADLVVQTDLVSQREKTYAIKNMSEDLECCYCKQLLCNPVSICTSQHVVCERCVEKSKSCQYQNCFCGEPVQITPVPFVKRMLNNLCIRCIQCNWEGTYADISAHTAKPCGEETKEHSPQAASPLPADAKRACILSNEMQPSNPMDTAHFSCPLCHSRQEYHRLDHEWYCPKRMVGCSNHKNGCTQQMTQDALEAHEKNCDFNQHPCPRHCSLLIFSKDQASHFEACQPDYDEHYRLASFLVKSYRPPFILSSISLQAHLLEGNIYQSTPDELTRLLNIEFETMQYYWLISQSNLAKLYNKETDVLVSSPFIINQRHQHQFQVVLRLYFEKRYKSSHSSFFLTIHPETFERRRRLDQSYARISVHQIPVSQFKQTANLGNKIDNLEQRYNEFLDYEADMRLESPLQALLTEMASHPHEKGKVAIGIRLETRPTKQ